MQKWRVDVNKFENSFYNDNIMEGYLKKDKMDKSVWKSNHVKRYFELNFKTATLTIKQNIKHNYSNDCKKIQFRDILSAFKPTDKELNNLLS